MFSPTDNQQRYNVNIDVLSDIGKEITTIAEIIPQANFIGLSSYTILLADVCHDLAVMLPQNEQLFAAWGAIDATCAIVTGVGQIMYAKSAPIANRFKGLTNIFAGTQLFWLLSLGLGPIGFAIDIAVAFSHALYDTAKTLRRITDTTYWRQDTKNELNYLISEHEKLQKIITNIQNDSAQTWLLARKKKYNKELTNKITELKNLLSADDNDPTKNQILQKELQDNIYDVLMLGVALLGVILLCVPGGQIPATIFISVAIVLFVNKFAPKVGDFFTEINRFFNGHVGEDSENEDTTETDTEGTSKHP